MTEFNFSRPRQLKDGENLADFHSGNEIVDTWAAKHAHHAKKRGTAVVYVSFHGEQPAGFYTLSSHSLVRNSLTSSWLKRNAPEQIPAVLLGMMGVDKNFQGQGLGSSLLRDAILKSLNVSNAIGAKALVLDPVNDAAESFYKHYGFKNIPGCTKLYLPLKTSA